MPGGESESSSRTGSSGSVMVSLDVGSLAAFDTKGDPHGLSQWWRKWKRSFKLYLTGKGVTDDAQKRALLLHAAGVDVQEIYFTLVSEDEITTFEATMKVLDDYFIPKANVPFERHLFRQIAQEMGETVDQFVCRLRQRAASCDQVIDKCHSSVIRRKFLEKEGAVSLDDLLRIARSQEAVDRQMKVMGTNASANQVNAVGGKSSMNKHSARVKICFGCGQDGHFRGDKKCPARGQACRRCGGIGHFMVRCPPLQGRTRGEFRGSTSGGRRIIGRGRGAASGGGGQIRGGKSTAGGGRFRSGRTRETNQVVGGDDGEQFTGPVQRSPDYAFLVEQCVDQVKQDSGLVTLIIGGVDLADVLIDSGATCNVVSQQTWDLLKQRGIRCESRKSAKALFAYGGTEPLPTLGTFTADVMLSGSSNGCTADFVVVKGNGRTLLGRGTAEKLGVLHIGPFHANNLSGRAECDVCERYSSLFSGVGLVKGYELKLHIDDTVKPVAQHVRRIPFGLREKVDKKLDELLELDIIEEVPEGPSEWVSPLVVVPKGDGDLRVCVDMRRANEAIVRERHPIPTVEELLHDLNGSTVFSKIDLKWGFHQILLSEESRHVTTFVTHRGLYRYKRLMFGVTSAPEKYQQIIRDVLKGCTGVANISDDLIVHGKDIEEHDVRLFAVLGRLSEVGLTVNGDKCQFRLTKLTFFGHELTSNGVNPSEEKVAAIRDARPPKDASEV